MNSGAVNSGAGRWRAVVDIGAQSTSLLLTDGTSRVRASDDTALGGSTLDAAGEIRSATIAGDALDRLAATLDRFAATCRHHDAEVHAVATSVGRRATNADELAAVVAAQLDVGLEVVDGGREAVLAFRGAAPTVPSSDGVVTIDLGGGSTDIALGLPASATAESTGAATDDSIGDPTTVWSMPLGASTVTAAYLHGDPPRPEELSAALSVVELHVVDLLREVPELGPALAGGARVVALGGAVTLAAVEIGLADDPLNGTDDGPLHGFELTREALEDVFRTVATETRADRAHNPGLPPTRVDEIVGGCAVLVEIMRQLDLLSVVVSQRGLADGALLRS